MKNLRVLAIFVASASLGASGGYAQTNSEAIPLLAPRDVLSEFDLRRLEYPPRALELAISGNAIVQCTALPAGQVSGCIIVKETTEGAGFGPASLRVMRNARLPEVEPATGERTFRVVFQFTLG